MDDSALYERGHGNVHFEGIADRQSLGDIELFLLSGAIGCSSAYLRQAGRLAGLRLSVLDLLCSGPFNEETGGQATPHDHFANPATPVWKQLPSPRRIR